MLADVIDGGSLPLLAEDRLVDPAFHLVEVLEVLGVLAHCPQELLAADRVSGCELGSDCLQAHHPVAECCSIAIDIVRHLLPSLTHNHLQKLPPLLRTPSPLLPSESVHEHIDSTVLYDEDAWGAARRNQALVGSKEPLFKATCHFRLEGLGPVAEEKDAALDDSKGVFVVDL